MSTRGALVNRVMTSQRRLNISMMLHRIALARLVSLSACIAASLAAGVFSFRYAQTLHRSQATTAQIAAHPRAFIAEDPTSRALNQWRRSVAELRSTLPTTTQSEKLLEQLAIQATPYDARVTSFTVTAPAATGTFDLRTVAITFEGNPQSFLTGIESVLEDSPGWAIERLELDGRDEAVRGSLVLRLLVRSST
jgi:hypothetical protein